MQEIAPDYLTETFSGIDVGQGFFLRYYPLTQIHEQEYISFDEDEDSLLISPYVSPRAKAKPIEKKPYKTKVFRPAYLKDKREFNPYDMKYRVYGESISQPLSPESRLSLSLVSSMREMK